MRLIEIAIFVGAVLSGFIVTAMLAGLDLMPAPSVGRLEATVDASFTDVGEVPVKADAASPVSKWAGDPAVSMVTSLSADEGVACAKRATDAEKYERGKLDKLDGTGMQVMPFSVELAGSASRVACFAAVRPARLCDPAQRKDLVALVNLYFVDYDTYLSASAGRDFQGGDMISRNETWGEMLGNMAKAARKAELDLINPIHARMKKTLKGLVDQGYLTLADFDGSRRSETLNALLAAAPGPTPACAVAS